MKKVRLITKEELDLINDEVSMLFGANNRITSGSLEEVNGNRRYNINFFDGSVYRSQAMLVNLGTVVKNIMDANEVFFLGVKLA